MSARLFMSTHMYGQSVEYCNLHPWVNASGLEISQRQDCVYTVHMWSIIMTNQPQEMTILQWHWQWDFYGNH